MNKDDLKRESEVSSEEITKTKKRGSFSAGKLFVLLVVVLALIGVYFYWFADPKSSVAGVPGQNEEAQALALQKETADLVAKVGRHLVLPKDETPQIAEISDAALAAKEQPFYADAQNGDKLLVYLTLRKAIIYSPARDLVVNVGPIYMEDGTTVAPTTGTTDQ